MKKFTSSALFALSLGLLVTPSLADPAALLIGNERYQKLGRASNGVAAVNTRWAFQRVGYETTAARDVSVDQLEANLTAFLAQATQGDPVAIVLTGQFVTTGQNTWFLLQDAPRPTLANISKYALPLALVFDIAARHPGQAIVALGASGNGVTTGEGMRAGIGNISVPQGVSVLTGTSGDMADFLTREALKEDVVLIRAMQSSRFNIAGFGYFPLTPMFATAAEPAPVVDTEATYWAAIKDIGTIEGYEAYLKRYPRGSFAAEARSEIAFIKDAPVRDARANEDALHLNREARRQIQSDLTLLGFNTRGIDGLFGPGTRGALADWQSDTGFPPTGFIDQDQLLSLRNQARQRTIELEDEARERDIANRREDRQYWRATGRDGSEAGLRAYLQRYPDGEFSDRAQNELDAILDAKRNATAAREKAVWDQVLAANDVGAYTSYLNEFPNGTFADEARDRIQALANDNSAEVAADREEESRLGLAAVTFLLVEQRLTSLGFEPGRVDGQLTKESRRAIRRFQRAANLPVTGYLSRATVVRLIAAK